MPSFFDLAEKPLPLLPHTADLLHELLGRRHARTPDLQRVILRDPAAAVAIFRHLHKIRPGSAAEVADISHAASLIGFASLQQLLVGLPRIDPSQTILLKAAEIHYSTNAHSSIFARKWSEIRGLNNLDTQATAAVLQHPAALLLAATDPEAALRANNATRSGVSLHVAYAAEFGVKPREANQALANRWGYPALAMRQEQFPDHRNVGASIVALAAQLARSSAQDWRSKRTQNLVTRLAKLLNQTEDQASSGLHELAAEAARELHPLGYPTLALTLIQEQVDDVLDPKEQQQIDRVLTRMNQSLPTPARHETTKPLQQALSSTLNEIIKNEWAKRVVFAMLNGDRSRLRARLALGGQSKDPIRQLDLATQQRNLFSLLLAKSQSLWVTDENRKKYQTLFPKELAAALNETDFFAMSVIVDERPIGILYADGPTLTEDGYALFRRQCKQAIQLLSRNRKTA